MKSLLCDPNVVKAAESPCDCCVDYAVSSMAANMSERVLISRTGMTAAQFHYELSVRVDKLGWPAADQMRALLMHASDYHPANVPRALENVLRVPCRPTPRLMEQWRELTRLLGQDPIPKFLATVTPGAARASYIGRFYKVQRRLRNH